MISAALRDVLDAFQSPDNKALMDKQKEAAGNDMMHMMHLVFPAATQIQMEAIQKYGFTPDGEGNMDQALKAEFVRSRASRGL